MQDEKEVVVELRGAAENFSGDVQFDLSGHPVPDINFVLPVVTWWIYISDGDWKQEHCALPRHLSKNM